MEERRRLLKNKWQREHNKIKREPLTLRQLKAALKYDPQTGVWVWLVQTARQQTKIGDVAGRVNKTTGRREVGIDGRRYIATRLAWFYMTGSWPDYEVDHIDSDMLNDRWSNLRLATRGQNEANKPLTKRNRSGFKGVSWDKERNKWKAQIKSRLIGRFDTPEEAHAAYVVELKKMHGDFARLS